MSDPYEQQIAFGAVIDVLRAVGATYAIWGGIAVVVHGEPRFTHDMDILLDGATLPVKLFVKRLRESHFFVDPVTLQKVTLEGGFCNLIHEPYQIKVDLYVPTEPALKKMLANRIHLPFDEARRAAYVSADDLIIAKLSAYDDSRSTRHLDDIAGVIRIQQQTLDLHQLDREAARLGIFGVWRRLLEENLV